MKRAKRGLDDLCIFNDYRMGCNRYGRSARAIRKANRGAGLRRKSSGEAGSTARGGAEASEGFKIDTRPGAERNPRGERYRNVEQEGVSMDLREKDLWASVLELAIKDLVGSTNRVGVTEYTRRQAFKWIWSSKTKTGSFNWVCEALGLHPEVLRDRLYQMFKGDVLIKTGKRIRVL